MHKKERQALVRQHGECQYPVMDPHLPETLAALLTDANFIALVHTVDQHLQTL